MNEYDDSDKYVLIVTDRMTGKEKFRSTVAPWHEIRKLRTNMMQLVEDPYSYVFEVLDYQQLKDNK